MAVNREVTPLQLITAILFCFLLVTGFMQRIDAMYVWESSPDSFLVKEEPMLANLDGYYYLNIARELQEGSYSTLDNKRAFPDHVHRSPIPPLLSVITAYSALVTGTSLNWTGVFTPAVLGPLLALPLFLFGLRWGGPVMGLSASVIGIFAPIYASRTNLGVLDTDCMNVTFALLCAYLFMRFGTKTGAKRYAFLAAGLLCFLLFLWWWDQSAAAVTALALSPLLIALLFYYRPSGKEGLRFFTLALLATVLLFTLIGWQKPFQLLQSLTGLFSYISKQDLGLYPNIGLFITEQETISSKLLMMGTAITPPVFAAAAVGLIWLIIKRQKETLFLLPMLGVGLLSLQAMRFAIFLIPVIALGFGFLLSSINALFKDNKIALFLTLLLVGYLGWLGFDKAATRPSYYPGKTIEGMQQLRTRTPQDAVIWSWWDEGHPLVYWADRATINDGMVHSGERTHFNALPLSTASYRMAANFMQFYAVRGIEGIKPFLNTVAGKQQDENLLLAEILGHGPDRAMEVLEQMEMTPGSPAAADWLEFFYPPSPPPLYLFLDQRMLKQGQFIFWYGTWDIDKQTGTRTLPVINLDNIPFDSQGRPQAETFSVDFAQGRITVPTMFSQPVPLGRITVADTTESKTQTYDNPEAEPKKTPLFEQVNPFGFLLSGHGQYELDLSQNTGSGILQDHKQAETIINRLYWRKNDYDRRYFRLVDQNLPHYQIWEVTGDRIASPPDVQNL